MQHDADSTPETIAFDGSVHCTACAAAVVDYSGGHEPTAAAHHAHRERRPAVTVVSDVEPSTVTAPRRRTDTLRAYVALTKPRIIELLLVTTVPAMVVAAGGLPSVWLVLATVVGGTFAAGSANAINCWADRDIDRIMTRTAHRPLAQHDVPPANALWFGIGLGTVATALLWFAVNPLSALLGLAAILIYVFVYTLGLKRRTAQNIVIGGSAGAFPALIGWSAVTGELTPAAWLLFGIVFAWTPPHFWALAMRFRDDYARAGVPMLPVVATTWQTTVQILAYTVVMVSLTLMLGAVAGLGPLYLATALGLGAWFMAAAWRLHRRPDGKQAMNVFRVSISYLGLLFGAMAVDTIIR